MTDPARHLLLLSGAGLPPWIWDDVARALGPAFSTTVAPRPAGGGGGPAEYAAAALHAATAERFTVVAHSAGGVVAAEIAARAPDRVDAVLAVSAVVPESGGSFVSALPAPQRWVVPLVMRVAGTRPPESVIRKSLAAGLEAEVVDRLVADFTPEPRSYYSGRVGAGAWPGRRGYVVTSHDKELAPALQRTFAERMGSTQVDELDTGHLPMLQDSAALALLIKQFTDHPA